MMTSFRHLMQNRKPDIFVWAIAFLLLQACIRLLLSPSLQADAAEIILSTQEFRLGYGDHPPLYAWLYTGLSSILGANLFTIVLVKYSLLCFGIYQIYQLVRDLGNEELAGFAILSYLFFWQIMPNMQIDYTHSVLLFAMTAWYLRLFFAFLESRSRSAFVLLALVAGLGLLTKPNFSIILLASLAAIMREPEYRKAFPPSRMLLLLFMAGLLASPYFISLYQEKAQAVDTGFVSVADGFSVLQGLKSISLFGVALAANFLPFSILGFIVLKKSNPGSPLLSSLRNTVSPTLQAGLLWRMMLAGLLLFAAAVFLFNASQVKERYLIPFDVLLPIAFALYFRDSIQEKGLRFMRQAALVMAVLLTLFNLSEIIRPYVSDKADSLNLPYRDLKFEIMHSGFRDGDNIIVMQHLYGGNLRVLFPNSHVITRRKNFVALDKRKRTLLIWVADRYGKEQWEKLAVPPDLKKFSAQYVDLSKTGPLVIHYAEAPYFYYPKERFKMGMLLLPAQFKY